MKSGIVAMDQSTSATKLLLLDEQEQIVRKVTRTHEQRYRGPGWVEQDAEQIWETAKDGLAELLDDVDLSRVRGMGLTNQRETVVFWDRATGRPVAPVISWQDARGHAVCERLADRSEEIRRRTGLQLSPYYSAAKMAYALEQDSELRQKAEAGAVCVGTVDTYLLYRLTGGRVFATDRSNAGRTQLTELPDAHWSPDLTHWFGIPSAALADRILPSDGDFGVLAYAGAPAPLPIRAVLGDSHAALFAQGCLSPGDVKATYGTGSSVMMNTGSEPVFSGHGLSTCVGFAIRGAVHYVLEGNVTCSGDTFRWLQDEAGLISDVAELESLAASVPDSGGVQLVPAFSGLGAPYFKDRARALICGMNRGTTRAHLARAALESVPLMNADILDAMRRDSSLSATVLKADGGPVRNGLLMQRQADFAGCPVCGARIAEASALGAGRLAGEKLGVFPVNGQDASNARDAYTTWNPEIEESERRAALRRWRHAVRLACATEEEDLGL